MANRTKRTPHARERFLEVLRERANVSEAAASAKIARTTAYAWRQSDPEFASAWDNALEAAADALEAEAWRRAVSGIERPIIWKGEVTGTVREYSDRLLECLLRAHRPEKYRERYQVQVAAETESLSERLMRARERVRAAKVESGKSSRTGNPSDGTGAAASEHGQILGKDLCIVKGG